VGMHGNVLQTDHAITINRWGGLLHPHTTQELFSLPTCILFTIFSIRSLAKLVIRDQEHLEDIWYDQYNVLHFDSCHFLHFVFVLILSMLL
jgi:hypothetical protein